MTALQGESVPTNRPFSYSTKEPGSSVVFIHFIQEVQLICIEREIIKHLASHATDRFRPMSGLISAARQYEDFHRELDARVKLLDEKLVGRWNQGDIDLYLPGWNYEAHASL